MNCKLFANSKGAADGRFGRHSRTVLPHIEQFLPEKWAEGDRG